MDSLDTSLSSLSLDSKCDKKCLKPVLKWVGGKTQIIDDIINQFPIEMNNYREIFLGGGSVLFKLLEKRNNKDILINGAVYAYDINETLISVYKNIQSNVNLLYLEIKKLVSEFKSIKLHTDKSLLNRNPKDLKTAMLFRENYYYWIRNNYNNLPKEDKNSVIGSSMFIFLNKTCFRGLYRESKNGFNVPYGNYSNPEIINEKHLLEVSELIKDVVFKCMSFEKSIEEVESGDYVYLDPPYAPILDKSFVGYSKFGFDINNHKKLFQYVHSFKNKEIKMSMSNSNAKLVLDDFPQTKYTIFYLSAKRSINSKSPGKKSIEVIIKNF